MTLYNLRIWFMMLNNPRVKYFPNKRTFGRLAFLIYVMFLFIFQVVNLETLKNLLQCSPSLHTKSVALFCDRPEWFNSVCFSFNHNTMYDVSSSLNVVTQIKNWERVVKQIRHARWIVIKQYWSLSGCLTIITLPPSECHWLEATSAWDGRRNHNNLTFDDDTLYFFSLHVYVLCLFLFRSFLPPHPPQKKDSCGLESTVHSSARQL